MCQHLIEIQIQHIKKKKQKQKKKTIYFTRGSPFHILVHIFNLRFSCKRYDVFLWTHFNDGHKKSAINPLTHWPREGWKSFSNQLNVMLSISAFQKKLMLCKICCLGILLSRIGMTISCHFLRIIHTSADLELTNSSSCS